MEEHLLALEKNDVSVFSDAALRSLGNHHQISGRNRERGKRATGEEGAGGPGPCSLTRPVASQPC